MTISEAKTLQPFVDSVVVKDTGKIMLVRLNKLRKAENKDEKDMALLKLDDGTWYTNDEVEKA